MPDAGCMEKIWLADTDRFRGERTVTDGLVDRNPNVLGRTPVFSGTRVPVRILMEHLEAGDRLDAFLDDGPQCRESRPSNCSNARRRYWWTTSMMVLPDRSAPSRLAPAFPAPFEMHTVQQMAGQTVETGSYCASWRITRSTLPSQSIRISSPNRT